MEQDEDQELLELYKTVMAAIKEEPKENLDEDIPSVSACAGLQFYCDLDTAVKEEITIEENAISWDDGNSAVAGWNESVYGADCKSNERGSGRRLVVELLQTRRECLSERSESSVSCLTSCPTLLTGNVQNIPPREHANGKYIFSTGLSHVSTTNRNEKPFACTICKSVFSDNLNLKQHLRTHIGKKPFLCTICNSRFQYRYGLKRHMHIHTGGKPFMCTVSDTKISVHSNLLANIRTHTNDKQFTCAVCGSAFSTVYNLNRHTRCKHEDNKPTKISSSSDLSKRKRNTRRKYVEPVVCTICESRFYYSHHLKRHMLIHTGKKQYTCTVCEARFTTMSCLKRHMRIHTGEKPYTCAVCGSKMSDRSNMIAHIRTHTNDKQFTCAVCESVFSTVSYLNRHRCRRQTDNKATKITGSSDLSKRKHNTRRRYGEPVVCTICESKVCDEAHLKKHMRTHMGEKPFTCVECGAKFPSSFCLKGHVCVEPSGKNLIENLGTASSRRRIARRGCGKLVACTACDPEPSGHARPR